MITASVAALAVALLTLLMACHVAINLYRRSRRDSTGRNDHG